MPYPVVVFLDRLHDFRPYFYLLAFGLSQLYCAYKHWRQTQVEAAEMEVLRSSFSLEAQTSSSLLTFVASIGEGDEDGEAIEISPEAAEAVKSSMERYIRERQALYSDLLDEKVKREQLASKV